MASPNPVTAEENSSPTEEASETLREKFMKEISGDPRFKEAKQSGKAFVIGGQAALKWRRCVFISTSTAF
jgi:hypothetical protein